VINDSPPLPETKRKESKEIYNIQKLIHMFKKLRARGENFEFLNILQLRKFTASQLTVEIKNKYS
jgi:hypothetical protein